MGLPLLSVQEADAYRDPVEKLWLPFCIKTQFCGLVASLLKNVGSFVVKSLVEREYQLVGTGREGN